MCCGADGSGLCKDATELSLTGSSRQTRSATYFCAGFFPARSKIDSFLWKQRLLVAPETSRTAAKRPSAVSASGAYKRVMTNFVRRSVCNFIVKERRNCHTNISINSARYITAVIRAQRCGQIGDGTVMIHITHDARRSVIG
jgi:hypothetical protein